MPSATVRPAAFLLAAFVSLAPVRADTLLVRNAVLITMHPGQPDSFPGWFTVGSDGRIAELAAGEPPPSVSADRTLDAAGRLVAPGFISAHSHIYMSPLRGLGHDVTLYGWFQAWDRYLRHTTADDIYWFTLHGALDFLRNGITTAYDFTCDGVFGPPAIGVGEQVARAHVAPGPFEEKQIDAKIDAGLRFINSISIVELGDAAATRARFEQTLAYAAERRKETPLLLQMAISGAVQFLPTKKTAYLESEYMERYGLLNQSHFLESPERVPEQQEKFAWYVEAGALGPRLIFGHFIHVTDEIVQAVADAGAMMSWQPTSNGRLADGIADIVRYRRAGIKVAVGLDDQSCTDVSDPFQNLRIGLYTMRGLHRSAAALSVREMLHLHTLGSAEVLGIEADVGSLAPGKFADFLVVDPRSPDTGPVYEPLATYVLAMSLRNLQQVYVGGRLVAEGTNLMTHDEKRLRVEIDARTDRIRAAACSVDLRAAAARERGSAKAIELYTAAIAAYPEGGDAYLDRGFAYWGAGRHPLAAADFTKAVELMPDSPRALIARGDLNHRFLARDFEACARDYARAYELDPDFPGFHGYTAELYLYTGEPEKTLAEAKKGLAREPADLIHQLNLAHALLFTGQVEEARKIYAELAPLEIAHGRKGAAFALRDFETIAEKGAVNYPQMALLKPWLESLL